MSLQNDKATILTFEPKTGYQKGNCQSSHSTRLLQFGVLMAVGESYARQATIKMAAEIGSLTALSSAQINSVDGSTRVLPLSTQSSDGLGGVQCLRRLLHDIERNPAPSNAVDIVSLVEKTKQKIVRRRR